MKKGLAMGGILGFFLVVYSTVYAQSSPGKELLLADKEKTQYVIVTNPLASNIDQFAEKELAQHLKQITGADFKTLSASSPEAAEANKRIFLGLSPLAQKCLGKATLYQSLKDQSAVIQIIGLDVFLYGKGKHGNLYAVYELLENKFGCRWLSAYGDVFIPKITLLKLSSGITVVPQPFKVRSLMNFFYKDKEKAFLYAYRNRQNLLLNSKVKGIEIGVDFFGPGCHTLNRILPGCVSGVNKPPEWHTNKNYFATNPEWFSMDEKGTRVNNRQLCFSNPALRKEFTKNALIFHKKLEEKTGRKQCLGIDLNDIAYNICCCKECTALQKKYHSPGGPFFDFLFEFCEKHPQIQFGTLAYQRSLTQTPPSNVKIFPENLTVIFCPINGFFSDTMDAKNQKDLDDLKGWTVLSKKVWVWYYPNPYNTKKELFFVVPPAGNIERLQHDIISMHKSGAEGTYFEHDSGGIDIGANFSELQSWVMYRLFQNPYQDVNKLIKDFTDHYYGKAAPAARQYLADLERERKAFIATGKGWNWNTMNYTYLTPENLRKWNALFDEAEKQVSGEEEFHLRLLRLGLDSAIIAKMEHNEDMPLFKKCAERMEKTLAEITQKRPPMENQLGNFKKWIGQMARRIPSKPLPKELEGFPRKDIRTVLPKVDALPAANRAEAPDANCGKAAVESWDGEKFAFGTYDFATKKYGPSSVIFKNNIQKGYQLYKLPKSFKLTPEMIIWGGKWMISLPIGKECNREMTESLDQLWDAYVSLKFENGKVYCDRAFLVKEK